MLRIDTLVDEHQAAERGVAVVRPIISYAGLSLGSPGCLPDAGRRWSRRRGASVVVTALTDAIAIDGSDVRRLVEEIPTLHDALRAAASERSHTDIR
jgi:hypothetical protein